MLNDFLSKRLNIEIIKTFPREAVKFAKNHFKGNKVVACEIGVFYGRHAKSMNKELNISKLYLIDPYSEYEEYKKDDAYYKLKRAKLNAHRINKKGNEIWIEKLSYGAELNLDQLDFLYIDGNHSYEYVKKDLEVYYKFIKKGGIIAGHDIQGEGVSKAVIEFANKNKLKVNFGDRRDWWIIKK